MKSNEAMLSPEIFTFNISGDGFSELSHSFLVMYPKTLLGIGASERWLKDPENELHGSGLYFVPPSCVELSL